MLIDIPFQPKWRNKMLIGQKTCTTRTKKYGEPSDTFIAFGYKFEILSTLWQPLGWVAHNLYREEGCNSTNEFIEVWKELHPRKGYSPLQKVCVHSFIKEA